MVSIVCGVPGRVITPERLQETGLLAQPTRKAVGDVDGSALSRMPLRRWREIGAGIALDQRSVTKNCNTFSNRKILMSDSQG